MTADELADKLGGRRAGKGWTARCPAHDDNNPSLSIREGDNGGTVVKCFSGCATEAVMQAVGLSLRDLAPPSSARVANWRHSDEVARYRYTDESGVLLYEVVRKFPKDFYQVPANGKRGIGAMTGVRLVLYRLPAVLKAVKDRSTVYVVEGEKDADRLIREGLCATTSPKGAGNWSYVADLARQVLRGADVVIVADRDKPGYKHARDVAASLRDVASSVVVVEAVEGKDVSNHLDKGHSLAELVEINLADKLNDATDTTDTDDTDATDVEPYPLVDLQELFTPSAVSEALVEGLAFPGRWTLIAAKAKVGKSSLMIHIALSLAMGIDPFTGHRRQRLRVWYVDAEMGRLDMGQRLRDLGITYEQVHPFFRYTDVKLQWNTVQGAAAAVSSARKHADDVVIIDGLNGVVGGGENDDTTWRPFFDLAVSPLKIDGVAVLTLDNLGHDLNKSTRGSTVKLDKPDGILTLSRTDAGVKLKTTHQRTSAYLSELVLNMAGREGDRPISYRQVEGAWPAGTREVMLLLERLGLPVDTGRERARTAIREAGETVRNEVLSAAIRARKQGVNLSGTGRATPSGTGATDRYSETTPDQEGDRFGDRLGQVAPPSGTGGAVYIKDSPCPLADADVGPF